MSSNFTKTIGERRKTYPRLVNNSENSPKRARVGNPGGSDPINKLCETLMENRDEISQARFKNTTLKTPDNFENLSIDEILRALLDQQNPRSSTCRTMTIPCKYCESASFTDVDRRQLVIHLITLHQWELSTEENGDMNPIDDDRLESVFRRLLNLAFKEANPVFKNQTKEWSLRWIACPLCASKKQFHGVEEFLKHWERKHPRKLMTCNMCTGPFIYAGSLLGHRCVGTATPYFFTKDFTVPDNSKNADLMFYECNMANCKQSFGCFFNFMVHLRREHFGCEMCLKILPSEKELKKHIDDHHDSYYERVCFMCSSTFKEKFELENHFEAYHNNDELNVMNCDNCNKKLFVFDYHFCEDVVEAELNLSEDSDEDDGGSKPKCAKKTNHITRKMQMFLHRQIQNEPTGAQRMLKYYWEAENSAYLALITDTASDVRSIFKK